MNLRGVFPKICNLTTPIPFICKRLLKNTSNILDPTMFADDTNLFFAHQDIRHLFQIVNQELENTTNGLFQINFH